MTSDIQLVAVCGLPEVKPGDDLAALIVSASASIGLAFIDGDILIVAQKIVSKSEGRLLDLAAVAPSERAVSIGAVQQRDPRLIEVILRESKSIIRRDAHVLITETHHGFICANAGVDRSNVDGVDCVALLPVDPDASARALQNRLHELLGVSMPVIVTDTFGRAWREGLTNAAIGVAGLEPLLDFRGMPDDHGKELSATVLAVADELAAASGLLMRKTARIPVVAVRGYGAARGNGNAAMLIRPKERDLFR